ncbi:unnamed protein product [Phaeothamnion confervicola]
MGGGASAPLRCEVVPQFKSLIDIEIETDSKIVNHYMPPTFPLTSVINETVMKRCRDSWKSILDGSAEGMKTQAGKAGIVLFYDEFFFRLFKRARVFIEVFPDLAQRGEVLMKALGFMLRISGTREDANETAKLYYLGRSHRYKTGVRPWMFSVYITTCLETIMYWLGAEADHEVGWAWTNLTAHVVRGLLQSYLKDTCIPIEYNQNYQLEASNLIMTQSVHSRFSGHGGGSQMPESQMRSQMDNESTAGGTGDKSRGSGKGILKSAAAPALVAVAG